MSRQLGYLLTLTILLAWWGAATVAALTEGDASAPRAALPTLNAPLREWWLYVLLRGERGTLHVWSSIFADPLAYAELRAETMLGAVHFGPQLVLDAAALDQHLDPRVQFMRNGRALLEYTLPGPTGARATAALLHEEGEWRLLHLAVPAGWDGFERIDLWRSLEARIGGGELIPVAEGWAATPPSWSGTTEGIEVVVTLVRTNPFDEPLRGRFVLELIDQQGSLLATSPPLDVMLERVGDEERVLLDFGGVPLHAVEEARLTPLSPLSEPAEATWYYHEDERFYWYSHAQPAFTTVLPAAPYRRYSETLWGESRIIQYFGPHEPRLEMGAFPLLPGGSEAFQEALLERWTYGLAERRTETEGIGRSRQGVEYVVRIVTGLAATGEQALVGLVVFEGDTHGVYFLLAMRAIDYAPGNPGREAWLEAIHNFRWE